MCLTPQGATKCYQRCASASCVVRIGTRLGPRPLLVFPAKEQADAWHAIEEGNRLTSGYFTHQEREDKIPKTSIGEPWFELTPELSRCGSRSKLSWYSESAGPNEPAPQTKCDMGSQLYIKTVPMFHRDTACSDLACLFNLFRPIMSQLWSSPNGSADSTPVRYAGRRFAQIIKLKPEFVAQYKEVHAAVWPEVLQQIKDCNIQDYSIFHDPGTGILFASFKYVGSDFDADMENMRQNPKVREWWRMTDGMQESLVPGAKDSESGEPPWWRAVEEVFYTA